MTERAVALAVLIVAAVVVGVEGYAETPEPLQARRHTATAGERELIAVSVRLDGEVYFYGAFVGTEAEQLTMVFLGSVGGNVLVSGVALRSEVFPETTWVWWSDGACELLTNTPGDPAVVVAQNVLQLVDAGGPDLARGLQAVVGEELPGPVAEILQPAMEPLSDEEAVPDVRVVREDDMTLVNLLWDQLAARAERATRELNATDAALLALEGVEKPQ